MTALLNRLRLWGLLLGVAVLVLLLDQVTKLLVMNHLALFEQWAPVPGLASVFTLTRSHNTGAAFSILPQGNRFLILTSSILSGGIFYFYHILGHDAPLLARLALAVMLGGALGNLVSRLQWGFVVDFLYIHGLPTIFNVADIAIVGGVCLLTVTFLLQKTSDTSLSQHTKESSADA